MSFTDADWEGNARWPIAKAGCYQISGERVNLIMVLFPCLMNTIVGGGGLMDYSYGVKLMMKLKMKSFCQGVKCSTIWRDDDVGVSGMKTDRNENLEADVGKTKIEGWKYFLAESVHVCNPPYWPRRELWMGNGEDVGNSGDLQWITAMVIAQ